MQAVYVSNTLTHKLRSVIRKLSGTGLGYTFSGRIFDYGQNSFDLARYFQEEYRENFIVVSNERFIEFICDMYATSLVGHVYNENSSIVKNCLWQRSTHSILMMNRASMDKFLGNDLSTYIYELGAHLEIATIIEDFITHEVDNSSILEELMPAILETMFELECYIVPFKRANPATLVDVIFGPPPAPGAIGVNKDLVLMVEPFQVKNHAGFQILFD